MVAASSATTFANIVNKENISLKKNPVGATPDLLESVIVGMQDVKANDITILDLRTIHHTMADYFVICHGSSNTQVKAIAQSVEKETAKSCGDQPWHVEGIQNAKWVLLDYVDIVVHIFDKEARDFYALEDLWADAAMKRVD